MTQHILDSCTDSLPAPKHAVNIHTFLFHPILILPFHPSTSNLRPHEFPTASLEFVQATKGDTSLMGGACSTSFFASTLELQGGIDFEKDLLIQARILEAARISAKKNRIIKLSEIL